MLWPWFAVVVVMAVWIMLVAHKDGQLLPQDKFFGGMTVLVYSVMAVLDYFGRY